MRRYLSPCLLAAEACKPDRLWIRTCVLVCIAGVVYGPDSASGNNADGVFRKHKQFWDTLAGRFADHTVTYKTGHVIDTVDSSARNDLQFARELSWILKGSSNTAQQDTSVVTLSNGKYQATIQRKGKSPWRIGWLRMRSQTRESFDQSNRFDDLFLMQVIDPMGISTLMANRGLIEAFEAPVNAGGLVELKIVSHLPNNSGVHPEYAGATVRITGSAGSYPSMVEMVQEDGVGTRLRYGSIVRVDEFELPEKVVGQYINSFSQVDTEGDSQFFYDYSHIDDPIDRAKCFLSYYGLPEPGAKASSWQLWILLAIVLAGIIGLGLWRLSQRRIPMAN